MIPDVTLDYPYLLALAAILPLLTIYVLRRAFTQRKARLGRLGTMDVISRIIPPRTLVRPGWRMVRLGVAGSLVGGGR